MQYKILTILTAMLISLPILAYEPFFMDDPALSPDGNFITFVYMNDLWEVAFQGGIARRLTSTIDNIQRVSYSPDGSWIYFNSDRDGRNKYYRIPSKGGPAELISNEDFYFQDWFSDGKSILAVRRVSGENWSYIKYDTKGLRPTEILSFGGSFATLSPDDKKIVFDHRGDAYRPAYEGSITGKLWLYDLETVKLTQLTDTRFSVRYPVFSKTKSDRVYFAESDSTQFQLIYMDNFDISTKKQLTNFQDWSVRKIAIARENDRIVFRYFNELWRFDPETDQASKININILEDNFPNPIQHLSIKSDLKNFAISPNQEFIVFYNHYDLFAVPTKGGQVKQITFDHKGINDVTVMSDNQTIYFISNVNGVQRLFRTNINNLTDIKQVSWSKDKYINGMQEISETLYVTYYQSNLMYKAVINEKERGTTVLQDEPFSSIPLKTKDNSKWIYTTADGIFDGKRTIRIKDTKTKKNSDIIVSTETFSNLMLDKNEKLLFFNCDGNIYVVNLFSDPNEKGDNWDKILKTNKKKNKKNSEWDINNENFLIRRKQLTNENGWMASPIYASTDSTLFYITGTALKKVKFDGKDNEMVVDFSTWIHSYCPVFTAGEFTHFYYTQGNKLYKFDIKEKKTEQIIFEYDYSYNREKLNTNIFDQVWANHGYFFYDSNMHGQDWNKVYEKFSPYSKEIRSTTELKLVIDEMIGRINASHTGFYPRSDIKRHSNDRGYIGAIFDYTARLENGIKIKEVYHGSELSDKYDIKANDVIIKINDTEVKPETEIDPLFTNQQKKSIKLLIKTQDGDIEAIITGITASEQNQLRYDSNVLKNFNIVKEATDGKCGYLRIQQMDDSALKKFEQDFLALNSNTEGLIIDVRGNGGGHIADTLFDIITRQQRAWTYSRYYSIAPRPAPHNIYQGKIVCLVDEDSFSNAEIFSIYFKDLKIGPLIGMPSSGSVIGTRPLELMDGSEMRLPIRGWYRMNMENMELTGAKPDILIPRTPEHVVKGLDPQLEKAIEVLNQILK